MTENDNGKSPGASALSQQTVALVRRQYELDREEAGQKLPVGTFEYRGIVLESRFSLVRELDAMKAVVDAMPCLVRVRIASIWCDSRAGACYTIQIHDARWAEVLSSEIQNAFLQVTAGFNGLVIGSDGKRVYLDPIWLEEGDGELRDSGQGSI